MEEHATVDEQKALLWVLQLGLVRIRTLIHAKELEEAARLADLLEVVPAVLARPTRQNVDKCYAYISDFEAEHPTDARLSGWLSEPRHEPFA